MQTFATICSKHTEIKDYMNLCEVWVLFNLFLTFHGGTSHGIYGSHVRRLLLLKNTFFFEIQQENKFYTMTKFLKL